MLKIVFFTFYNLIFIPIFILLAHIGMFFNAKLRRGVVGRYRSLHTIKKEEGNLGSPRILFHCASMGEFEHIKPFVQILKERIPSASIIVMFFSPSGFENVKKFSGVDLFIYTPFDWWLPVWRLYRRLKPAALVVAKHDVWPNQIWLAKWMGIPTFLINASLHKQSSRLKPGVAWFQKSIYSSFTKILTISPEDKNNFEKLAPAGQIAVVGDTKYDQAVKRSEESRKKTIFPPQVISEKTIFVAGSTWPEDEIHLIPAFKKLTKKYQHLLFVICPHEPTESHLTALEKQLQRMPTIRFSEIQNYKNEVFILIDTIGILANLYSIAHIAYVGGSFKQNIHNVLEPAVYGIPVLFGPVNQNSHEAQLLKKSGGAFEIQNITEIFKISESLLKSDSKRREVGQNARQVVLKNCGATEKTLAHLTRFIQPE